VNWPTFGDSRTSSGGWQSTLHDLVSVATAGGTLPNIPNRGASGATVTITLTGIAALISGTPTDAPVTRVLLNLGVNDILFGLPASQTTWQNNYVSIIEAIHTAWPAATIHVAIPYRGGGYDASCDTLAMWIVNVVAVHPTYTFVGQDERAWLKPGIATYSDDGVHYNAAGKVAAAAAWAAALGY